MSPETVKLLARRLEEAERIVITSHIAPDGDAVGSTLALLRALKSLPKKVWAILPSHVPGNLGFLLADETEVIRYDPRQDDPILEGADLFVMVDCAYPERAGEVGKKMLGLDVPLAVIDHHSTNSLYGRDNYVVPGAAATGALVMNILDALGIEIGLDLALPLYVALVTDTGNFSYPGTTPVTHQKAERLLAAGVRPYEVQRKLYLNRSSEFMRLAGMSLLNVQIGYQGLIAYSVIHHDLYRKFTPNLDELTLLPPYLLAIEKIEVGVLFLEYEPGRILVELRSQGLINAAEVARKFGGGGHAGAGGTRIGGDLPDIVFRVLSEVDRRLRANLSLGESEDKRSELWRRN